MEKKEKEGEIVRNNTSEAVVSKLTKRLTKAESKNKGLIESIKKMRGREKEFEKLQQMGEGRWRELKNEKKSI